MNQPVLQVRDLRKAYGDTIAVDGASFEVGRGEIFGVLGPNGAGKTTMLECIEGLRKPDHGSVAIGRDGAPRTRVMGVQLQTGGLPSTMNVDEAMSLFCAYHGVATRDDLIQRFGLGDKRSRRYGDLSVGNQRRLALALAIAHEPEILMLDEPTAGLDVGSRAELHTIMRELADAGTAIVLATHDMAEAEKMADTIAIVLGGRIVVQGSPRDITATGSDVTRVTVATVNGTFADGAVALPAAELTLAEGGYAVYLSTDSAATVTSLLALIGEGGDTLTDLRVERPSLEERFLEITGTASNVMPAWASLEEAR